MLLKTNKLCKTFSNAGIQQHVLRNIDLEIYEGDFTVIMGASGGGKSTLLYALSGMDTPTLGDVYFVSKEKSPLKQSTSNKRSVIDKFVEDGFGEENIAKYSQDKLAVFRRENCGFVFQQIYLVESMSVLDNVLIAGMLLKIQKKELAQRAKELLNSMGIDESLWKKLPNQLSGGEAQRVGVARALINNPKILFADEPTGALNSVMAVAVLDSLSMSNNNGQSVVMVTHDINSALRGNRILYLKDGKIEGELKLEKFKGEYSDRRKKVKEFLSAQGW
ncbi:MAG: ABC transporter ATP-binding protein [Firmicutes bacterium]|nr:ABC transporter ATP-binding protein [Bacillota bacterium]